MKGVQETCCMCTTPIDDNSVHFLCNCLITICKECAYEQLARNRSTFRSHIVCPVCGSQECNIANQAIDGVEKAENVEKELIKQACTYFKESKPQSFKKKVLKLIPLYRKLIVSFSELGYPSLKSPFVSGSHRDDVNVLGLHVARCEAHRQEIEREHGTSNFIPFESRPDFALGPLEKVILKSNHTLEKILDIAKGRDREANRLQLHCPSCYESLGPGNTVRMMCSCFTYNCQLCQRRIMKNYKNTFRDSPAKCNTCNSPSIPFENINEALDLEKALLKQHPMFKTGASVHMLWHIYVEIADLCKMDRAINYNDFIDRNAADLGRGSNNYCSKAMCFLEMARMEVERTRRKFYRVSEEERSDVANLPLGPLARLRIRRHVFLEAFINFVRGTETSAVHEVTDLEHDTMTMKDPGAQFDESTNRLVEKDGPGGELEPAVVRQIQQEAQSSPDETTRNRTYSLLLRTKSAPCPHPHCTFDACCPVYLEQHIQSIHVEHLDEAEPIVPKKRPSRKAAQAAQAALRVGNVTSLENFEEDDLNRALAESLLTSEGTGRSSSSSSRGASRPELHFRADEQIEEEEESDSSVEVLLDGPRMTRAQRQSASATSVANRAAEASRAQVDDGEECEFNDETPSHPSRRSSAGREQAPESPVEEKGMSQLEEDSVELRELLGDSDSPEQKARKRLQKHKPNKHTRELKPAPLAETVAESSSGSELESASEEELEEIPRISAASARSASPAASSSQRAAEEEAPRSSNAAGSVEQASHRIKKRKTAYLEDSDEGEATQAASRSHHSKHGSRDKDHKNKDKEKEREKEKERRHRVVVPPGVRPTKPVPVPERPTSAHPAAPVAGGFNLATAMAAASTAALAAAAAASSVERQPAATAPLGPAVTESGKDPAPPTATMHARQRRREVLLEANKAHQLAEESDSQRKVESPEHARPDKRVRFAPVVECQEYRPPVHAPEVVEIDVEERNYEYPPQAPMIPPIPPSEDFFSIVDRLKTARLIPPPLPPSPPPPVSMAPPPLVTPAPVPTTPVARVMPAVEYIGTRPPSPPRPPPPPSDDEDDDSTEGPHDVPALPYLQLRQAKNEREEAVSAQPVQSDAPYTYAISNTSENFIRQSEARYYHEPYRPERTDEERSRAAKPFSVPGLPYMEDINRFAHKVLQEPSEVWRAGEAYVNLTRPNDRKYELVFDIDKPRPANAAELLNVRAKFMLRFPDGALKKMTESTPCKEKGYSQVEIKMETMQAELVAVLKLIALPRFGFRGKIQQWGTTRDTLLQAKGTFHKYGIMPDTFITLRDLSDRVPDFIYDERAKAPPLSQAQQQLMLPAKKGPFQHQRKQRNRMSNAEFALMSEEKKRLAREAEKQANNRAAIAQYGALPEYTQHPGSVASESPMGSASESITSSTRAIEPPPRVRLDRWGEPMDGPRTSSKGAASVASRADSSNGASKGSTDEPEKGFMATPPPVSTPSASTPSPVVPSPAQPRPHSVAPVDEEPEEGMTNTDTDSGGEENPTFVPGSPEAVRAAQMQMDCVATPEVLVEESTRMECSEGSGGCGTPDGSSSSAASPPSQQQPHATVPVVPTQVDLTAAGATEELPIEVPSDSEPDEEAWSLASTAARLRRAAAHALPTTNTATTAETAVVLEEESDDEPVEWSLGSLARAKKSPSSPVVAPVQTVPVVESPLRRKEAEEVVEMKKVMEVTPAAVPKPASPVTAPVSAAPTPVTTAPTPAASTATGANTASTAAFLASSVPPAAVVNAVSPPPLTTPRAPLAASAPPVKAKRSRFDADDSLFMQMEPTSATNKRARFSDDVQPSSGRASNSAPIPSVVSSGSDLDRRDRAFTNPTVPPPGQQHWNNQGPPLVNQPVAARPSSSRSPPPARSGFRDAPDVAVREEMAQPIPTNWPGAKQPPLKKSTSRFGADDLEPQPIAAPGPWVEPPKLAKTSSRFGAENFYYDPEESSSDSSENWEGPNKRKHGRRKAKLPPREQTAGSTNSTGLSNKKPPIYFDTSVKFAQPRAPPSTVPGVNTESSTGIAAVNLDALRGPPARNAASSSASYYGPSQGTASGRGETSMDRYSGSDRGRTGQARDSRDRGGGGSGRGDRCVSRERERGWSPDPRGRGRDRSPDREREWERNRDRDRYRARSPSPSPMPSPRAAPYAGGGAGRHAAASPYDTPVDWAVDRRAAPVGTLPLTQSSLSRQPNLASSEVPLTLEQREALCRSILGQSVNVQLAPDPVDAYSASRAPRYTSRSEPYERDPYGPGGANPRDYYSRR